MPGCSFSDPKPSLFVTFAERISPLEIGRILISHGVRAAEYYHGNGEAPVLAGDVFAARRVAAKLIAMHEVVSVRIA